MSSSDPNIAPEAAGREKRTASGVRSTEWLVNIEGDQVVPMSTTRLVDGVRAGRLPESSLVWRIGMHDWSRVVDVPQLRLAVGSPSPPRVAPTFVPLAPLAAQAEARRRLDTLPFGLTVARDPATGRPTLGIDEDADALAVYDRPSASLTFPESMRDDWQPPTKRTMSPPPKPSRPNATSVSATPVSPASASPASASPAPASVAPAGAPGAKSSISSSLAASHTVPVPGQVEKRSPKRAAIWTALGMAAAAALFAFWTAHTAEPEYASPPATDVTPAAAGTVFDPTVSAEATPSVAPPANPLPSASSAAAAGLKLLPSAATATAKPAAARPTRPRKPAALAPQVDAGANDVPAASASASATTTAIAPSAAPLRIEPPTDPSRAVPLVPSNF